MKTGDGWLGGLLLIWRIELYRDQRSLIEAIENCMGDHSERD